MNVYDSIMKALSNEDNHFGFPAHLDRERAAHYLSFAPHESSREPHLMFAFDNIGKDLLDGKWRHTLRVELFTISSILNMREIRALSDLEEELTAELLKTSFDCFNEVICTPSSWDVANMFLCFPRYALPIIQNLGHQRRNLLLGIFTAHTPERDPDVTRNDFFCAYCLGNYIESQLEGISWHYLDGSIIQGMDIPPIDDDSDAVIAFQKELVSSYEYKDYDSWPEGLTPAEVMNEIVRFYNSFMKYRDLLFVKKKLNNIMDDVKNYSELVQYCE